MAAALAASAPYSSRLPVEMCMTMPVEVEQSPAAHFQVSAAAAISICRPAAPARRSGSQLNGVEKLPPANCGPYLTGSLSACWMRTFSHGTSSSSAISIGSMVLMP